MKRVDCPVCGARATAGRSCPTCGSELPQPSPDPAPPRSPGRSYPGAAGGHRGQWEAIQGRLERAAAPRYRVKGIVGYGGMAGVYLADEPRLGRDVAIKVMSPGLMVDPTLVERFRQEARTIARLDHPNIVTVYEVDEREGLHWFTMTYVAGRTLGQVLADSAEHVAIPVAGAILYQVGDALAYAHERGVVHRDVKPGNVLLDQRGNALVTDFGIAKLADAESGLTRTGVLVGTPAYMSPEQCMSKAVTGASDQYSLGVVLYEMLTGRPPFEGATLAVLQAHVAAAPTPVRELRPDCPEALASTVERMLVKRPEDRWPSVSAAVAAAGVTAPRLEGPVREQLSLLAASPASIEITPHHDVLPEGTHEPVAATVVDGRGRRLTGRRVAWSSSDPEIASVSGERLHAGRPGRAWIAATSGTVHASLHVTVTEGPVQARPAARSVTRHPPADERATAEKLAHTYGGRRLAARGPRLAAGLVLVTVLVALLVARPWRSRAPDPAAPPSPSVARSAPGASQGASQRTSARPATGLTPDREPDTTPSGETATGPASRPPGASTPVDSARPARSAAAPVGPDARASGGPDATRDRTGSDRPAEVDPPPGAAGDGRGEAQADESTPSATGAVEITGSLPPSTSLSMVLADGTRQALAGRSATLAAGRYTLRFEAPGYYPDQGVVEVRPGATASWAPVVEAAPGEPEPGEPGAGSDAAAIDAAVRRWGRAFSDRQVAHVVPLLPADTRAQWRALLEDRRAVTDFRASVDAVEPPVVRGDRATVAFSVTVAFRSGNALQRQTLEYRANAQRAGEGWRIVSLAPR